jgi:carbamoyltransferase
VIILGINDGHQASAALMVDGRLVAAVAEERFTRRKNEHGYPGLAIDACLRLAGIERSDIDSDFSIADFWREQTDYWYPTIYEGKKLSYADVFKDKLRPENFVYDRSFLRDDFDVAGMQAARRKFVRDAFGLDDSQVSFRDHHACHAYYGLLAAPAGDREFLVMTADGFGDRANASIWRGRRDLPLKEILHTDKCHIGRMYRYATLLLGMKPAEHEYKVMGLAPYASPDFSQRAYEVYAETLQVDGLDFSYKVTPRDNFFHFRDRLAGQRFDAIAYAIQRRTEELIGGWIGNTVAATGLRHVVFSGGVAQNIKANKRVWELDLVDDIFVPPGAHDESLSIGAAYMAHVLDGDGTQPGVFPSAYLGTSYDRAAVDRFLDDSGARYRHDVRTASPADVARLLAEGCVVGWLNGRMEFGARALGARSIITNAGNPDAIRQINTRIKMRDFWMPFAPSMLAERAADYIVNPKGIDGRYMTMAFETTPRAHRDIPAALHPYDRTARPNIVGKADNPEYHELIREFEKLTGVGAILNTSFNLHGEPVVESPADALSTFERCGMEHLYMAGSLVSKKQ